MLRGSDIEISVYTPAGTLSLTHPLFPQQLIFPAALSEQLV
jgi:hypothetical protein